MAGRHFVKKIKPTITGPVGGIDGSEAEVSDKADSPTDVNVPSLLNFQPNVTAGAKLI